MFDLSEFIAESNKIDPQPNLAGEIVPGAVPGDQMYDNMLRAWELAMDYALWPAPLPANYLLKIHRELTRGIDFLEWNGNSGLYRNVYVRIGEEICPSPSVIQSWIEELLIPHISRLDTRDESEAVKQAWWVHDYFECVHPFFDGNGRTGRILLNAVRARLGLEPIVVPYRKYHLYAYYIKRFRRSVFEKAIDWLRTQEGPQPVRPYP